VKPALVVFYGILASFAAIILAIKVFDLPYGMWTWFLCLTLTVLVLLVIELAKRV